MPNTTAVGTMQINKKGIPPKLKDAKNRQPLWYEIYWEQSSKTWHVNIIVHCKNQQGYEKCYYVIHFPPLLGTTKDDEKDKPALYKLYDFMKGGTDIIVQRMWFYSLKLKSRRWTITAFCYVLDMARVNAFIVMLMNQKKDPKKIDSFQFGYALVDALVKPFILIRSTNGLNWIIRLKMEWTTGEKLAAVANPNKVTNTTKTDKRGRCVTCMEESHGKGHKVEKSKLSKVSTICQVCKKTIGTKHLVISQICNKCNIEETL